VTAQAEPAELRAVRSRSLPSPPLIVSLPGPPQFVSLPVNSHNKSAAHGPDVSYRQVSPVDGVIAWPSSDHVPTGGAHDVVVSRSADGGLPKQSAIAAPSKT